MAWTDQCKVAFSTNAKALQLKQSGRKNISKILKQLAEESGIPFKTLERWWYEQESLKNEGNPQGSENNTETTTETTTSTTERPICYACKKNKVELDQRTGKPHRFGTALYGLCWTCRNIKAKVQKIDNNTEKDEGIMAVCPKCSHVFYINKNRVGGNQNGDL